MKQENKKANALIHESSPYLLQHAYNPVDWHPWNDSTLELAKRENKPLLISIGYSACHWCHVMEKESFEDTSVANLMNEYFVCIKVDREERPDIDQIYMDAVQVMNGRGGWPLNCFALPDGSPIYGGTYFPKDTWIKLLGQLHDLIVNDPEKVKDYASRLREGLIASETIASSDQVEFPKLYDSKSIQQWQNNFDEEHGGMNRAPKFPMPNTLEFLLHFNENKPTPAIEQHVYFTLEKMAAGGIYDQLGGGFARYSVDAEWKVPHFEKMLYDNAQLISLYAKAYRKSKNPLFKEVVEQTSEFIERELKAKEGIYYSALDADSEGEEGKFYTWSLEELKALGAEDFELLETYFDIPEGRWEDGRYILMKKDSKTALQNFPQANQIKAIQSKLLALRGEKIRPGLDDKCISSWNALLMMGYLEAYQSFGDKKYLERAKSIASFITVSQKQEDGGLWRNYKNQQSSINAFLDDYSFSIEGLLTLFCLTGELNYLEEAEKLILYCEEHFFDPKSGLFFYTSDKDPALIVRKIERVDNVIPASNSSMAKALNLYGRIKSDDKKIKMSRKMLSVMKEEIERYPSTYSNWASLAISFTGESSEIMLVGEQAIPFLMEIQKEYLPNTMFIASKTESQLEILKGKFQNGETLIYVCQNQTCKRPNRTVKEALEQL